MAPARQQQHYTPTHALACPHQGRSRLDSEQQRGSPLGGYFLTAVSDQSCSEYPYISRPRPCCAFGGSCAFDAVFYQPAVAVFANLLLERVVGNTEPYVPSNQPPPPASQFRQATANSQRLGPILPSAGSFHWTALGSALIWTLQSFLPLSDLTCLVSPR